MAANSAGKGLNGSHVVLEPASEPNPSRERDVHPTVKTKHWGRASRKMEANFKLRRASASLNSKHSVGLHDEESFYEHNPDHDRPQIMGGDNWQAGYKISKHWLTTIAVGAAKKGKLLRYDLARLLHIGGILCIFVKGTVFTMDPWTNIIVMLNMLFGFCVFLFVNWYAVEDPNPEHIEGLAKYMNGIVPFVLALYLSLSISRWWALRTTALGEIFDALSNTAMMFYCYFPGEEFAPMRSCISHYGIASVYLLAAACREKDVCEELVKNNLLSREEAAIVSLCNPFQRPMLLWAWILRITYEAWMLDGKPPPIYGGIQAQVFKARDGIQTVHTYLDTQLPFAYVHLIILLVNLNNLLIGIQSGLKFVVAYRREEYLTLCSEALFLFLVPLCYQGLLTITYIIHDPFGEDMLDFPIMAYTEYVKDTCSALDLAQQSCPAMEATKSAQIVGGGDFAKRARENFATIREEKKKKAAKASPPAAPAFQPPPRADPKLNASVEKMITQVASLQTELMGFLREEQQAAEKKASQEKAMPMNCLRS